MTGQEYLYCIKKLNPQAHVVIWVNEDGTLRPAWDDAHVGIKPTEDDCQVVLTEVQEDLARVAKDAEVETLIQSKIREQAITALQSEGKLDTKGMMIKE